MPVTIFVFWLIAASLLLGLFTGQHGLFDVTVWGVVALVPAVVIDAIWALLRPRACAK